MEIYYIVCQEYLECCYPGQDKDVCKIVAVADVNFINEAWFVNHTYESSMAFMLFQYLYEHDMTK